MARTRVKRKKDNILRDALILLGVTAVLSLVIVAIFSITKNPIDRAAEEGKLVAYKGVFASVEGVDVRYDETINEKIEEYMENEPKVRMEEGVKAFDKSQSEVGRAYIVSTKGYSANKDISLAIGIDMSGKITAVDVISMEETAGLGANCTNDEFKGQFAGKSGEFKVTKSGNAAENEINAITGATITSEAVTLAVNECIKINNSIN